jgi:Protein of unknown function (DUF3047)
MRLAVALFACIAAIAHAQDVPPPFSKSPPGALPKGWAPITLPYGNKAEIQLVADDGVTVLRVRSADAFGTAASTMDVDLEKTPVIRWRWKVDRVVDGANMEAKEGEDFAARVYVSFDYPVDKLPLSTRTKISVARTFYDFVPAAAICYVWDNKHAVGASLWSPHFDHVRVIVLESGNAKAGQWIEETRDVRADFAAAFADRWKGAPPHVNGITAGNDTDQTDETATAWFGDFHWKPAP